MSLRAETPAPLPPDIPAAPEPFPGPAIVPEPSPDPPGGPDIQPPQPGVTPDGARGVA